MLLIKLFPALFLAETVCKMEPFVVGGNETQINQYPHSVYLNVLCDGAYICGGSILNQDVMLTAAHCLEDCATKKVKDVYIKYGHEHLEKMKTTKMKDYILHEGYDEDTMANDLALVMAKQPIRLERGAKRIALKQSPPKNYKLGFMAGWGVMNFQDQVSIKLLDAIQELQPPEVCKMLGTLPAGSFCAGPVTGVGAPDKGDSGSALVVNNFIQIGIVSYKIQRYSLVVYTNVSYHFNWIERNAVSLVCRQK